MSGLADALNKYKVRRKNIIPDVFKARTQQSADKIDKLYQRDDGYSKDKYAKATGSNYYKGQVIQSFKNGGTVPKTGVYKLHKGEKVVSKKQLNKIAEKKLFNK